jgi:hypothetical protein
MRLPPFFAQQFSVLFLAGTCKSFDHPLRHQHGKKVEPVAVFFLPGSGVQAATSSVMHFYLTSY